MDSSPRRAESPAQQATTVSHDEYMTKPPGPGVLQPQPSARAAHAASHSMRARRVLPRAAASRCPCAWAAAAWLTSGLLAWMRRQATSIQLTTQTAYQLATVAGTQWIKACICAWSLHHCGQGGRDGRRGGAAPRQGGSAAGWRAAVQQGPSRRTSLGPQPFAAVLSVLDDSIYPPRQARVYFVSPAPPASGTMLRSALGVLRQQHGRQWLRGVAADGSRSTELDVWAASDACGFSTVRRHANARAAATPPPPATPAKLAARGTAKAPRHTGLHRMHPRSRSSSSSRRRSPYMQRWCWSGCR